MSVTIDGNSTVVVKVIVEDSSGNPITNFNGVDVALKDLLIAAFESIPSQSDGTATVAAIVTALKTIV
jgi:hypothetical protein